MSNTLEKKDLVFDGHQTLEEFFTPKALSNNLPLKTFFSNEQLVIESTELKFNRDSSIELVVYSSLVLAKLVALQPYAKLNIMALHAINSRNNNTSYRFTVHCEDLTTSRKLVAEFSLKHNVEMALLQNAPVLSAGGVLVMDMDSTTIEIECIDEIAKLAGVGEQVSQVTELAMEGKLDFSQSLHQRVATLNGSSVKILEEVVNSIPLMPGLETLVEQLKQHNWRIAIASGGFTYFADYLKNQLNLDATRANVLEIKDGVLTGKVLGDVVDAKAKADCLSELAIQYNIPHAQTVAMGDGANDLVMMAAAGFGVAFHAKPIVLAEADSSINHQGLDCLLHWLA